MRRVVLLFSLLVGCNDAPSPYLVSDLSPPVVSDLQSLYVSEVSIELSWSAPRTGFYPAVVYDVRYSTEWLTEDFWDRSASVPRTPTPKAEGETEYLAIYGLDPGTEYSFGVRSRDKAGNWSSISNVILVATSPPDAEENYYPLPIGARWHYAMEDGSFETWEVVRGLPPGTDISCLHRSGVREQHVIAIQRPDPRQKFLLLDHNDNGALAFCALATFYTGSPWAGFNGYYPAIEFLSSSLDSIQSLTYASYEVACPPGSGCHATRDHCGTFVVEGEEDVEVAAGTFRAKRIRWEHDEGTLETHYLWFADDVGLIKAEQFFYYSYPLMGFELASFPGE